MSERARGTVKFFNDEKGFGFIVVDEIGNDVFVHHRQVADGVKLTKGLNVSFVIEDHERGPRARDVKLV